MASRDRHTLCILVLVYWFAQTIHSNMNDHERTSGTQSVHHLNGAHKGPQTINSLSAILHATTSAVRHTHLIEMIRMIRAFQQCQHQHSIYCDVAEQTPKAISHVHLVTHGART